MHKATQYIHIMLHLLTKNLNEISNQTRKLDSLPDQYFFHLSVWNRNHNKSRILKLILGATHFGAAGQRDESTTLAMSALQTLL